MKRVLFCISILLLLLGACSPPSPTQTAIPPTPTATNEPGLVLPKIDRYPEYRLAQCQVMGELPGYDPSAEDYHYLNTPDFRGCDLSKFDLRESLDYLLVSQFDSKTNWPDSALLPEEFNFKSFLEFNNNPGLGLHQLHSEGIDGKGIGIAIIDEVLLVDHIEYKEQIRLYEELDDIEYGKVSLRASNHAPAVASIAVGKNIGVAPAADLYFIATYSQNDTDCHYYANAILRFIEINKHLPEDRKIRVISVSDGWGHENMKGYDALMEAIELAQEQDILILNSTFAEESEIKYGGLGRYPLNNPDEFSSFGPGYNFANRFFQGKLPSDILFVPMDSRTLASQSGIDQYAFSSNAGLSWVMPYIAGVYALACQAEPDITPDDFWQIAWETGVYTEIEHEGEMYTLGPIINPVGIIEVLTSGE